MDGCPPPRGKDRVPPHLGDFALCSLELSHVVRPAGSDLPLPVRCWSARSRPVPREAFAQLELIPPVLQRRDETTPGPFRYSTGYVGLAFGWISLAPYPLKQQGAPRPDIGISSLGLAAYSRMRYGVASRGTPYRVAPTGVLLPGLRHSRRSQRRRNSSSATAGRRSVIQCGRRAGGRPTVAATPPKRPLVSGSRAVHPRRPRLDPHRLTGKPAVGPTTNSQPWGAPAPLTPAGVHQVGGTMYDKLKREVVKQSSGSSANGTRIELVYKQFKDEATIENFEKHLTFYRSKNAALNAVGAGFDDSFLAWLLLNSFSSNDNPVWSMASTNIVTSDIPINQWSFNHISGKLREALRNNIRPAENASSSTSQSALNATSNKTNPNRYNGPPCTHPGCRCRKAMGPRTAGPSRRRSEKWQTEKNTRRRRRRGSQLKVTQKQKTQAPIQTQSPKRRNATMLTGHI
jgi:hypothetical protein